MDRVNRNRGGIEPPGRLARVRSNRSASILLEMLLSLCPKVSSYSMQLLISRSFAKRRKC